MRDFLNHLVFGWYPYLCLTVFLIGSLVRFDREQYTWRSGSSQLLRRRQLMWGSNLFHVGILVIFFGHFVGLLTPIWVFDGLGISHTAKQWMAIIIGGVAGDQQAAMFGQACHQPGMAKNTYGTGCFMLLHTGGEMVQSSHGLVSTPCAYLKEKEFALEGSVFVAGAVVQWLRDGLGFFKSSSEIEALANSVLDSGDVYIVPAFGRYDLAADIVEAIKD